MKAESISVFYKSKFGEAPAGVDSEHGHFNVFRLDECHYSRDTPVQYTRRDYYKIALMRGEHRYHYGDKTLEVGFEAQSPQSDGCDVVFDEPRLVERTISDFRDES